MATYICKRCGKQFELVGFSNYCWDCRHRTTKCVICGKNIIQKDPKRDTLTCSRECWGKWRVQSGQSKQVSQKARSTKEEKYGDANYRQYKPKKCKICDKEFIPTCSWQTICTEPHYGPCPVCGKPTLIIDFKHGPRACSKECRAASISKALKSKDLTESLAKGKQTMLERYGVENYSQTAEWKKKVKETSRKKYGSDWAMQSEEFKTNRDATIMERYGVDNAFKSPEIIAKIKEIQKERYGGIGWASEVTNAKIQATNKERYGNEIPSKTLQIKNKMKATTLERYGAEHYNSTKEGLSKLMLDPSKIDNFWEFRKNPKLYVESNYAEKPYVDTLATDLGVNETSIYDILINKNCKDIINRSRTSVIEREVFEFLSSLVSKEEILWGDHRTITPLELDFYLPNYKFAIECNPTYTHNSSLPSFNESKPKPTVHHRNKTQKAEEAGVFLLHIFGYEWKYKQDIIKSIIRNCLYKSERKIFARNTIIKQVDAKTTREFLNANHRQGDASSPIRLGLYTKDSNELVSVMTFSKTRNTIGKKQSDCENSFELVRFCSLLNTSVVGAASKLFKYFVDNYNPFKIIF